MTHEHRAILIAIGAAAALGACQARTPPARDPGLWSEHVQAGGFDEAILVCMGDTETPKVDLWGTQYTRFVCGRHTLEPRADGAWTFTSVCDKDSLGVVTTRGVATGDFRRNFHMEATTVTTGARDPALNGTRAIHISSVWQGPHCPLGVNPADLHIPRVARPPG
jgi:hypothetical protein